MRWHVLLGIAALNLVGCSAGGMGSYAAPEDLAGPEPPYRAVVSLNLEGIVGDPVKAGVMEISRPRLVDSFKGPAWQVCLKTQTYTRPQYFAVFIQGRRVVDSRSSVISDRCAEESYSAFDDWFKEQPLPDEPSQRPGRSTRSGKAR